MTLTPTSEPVPGADRGDLAVSVQSAAATAQHELLAPMAPAGIDLVAARSAVERAAALRRRGRWATLGSAAVLVLVVAGVVLALTGDTDPDDVMADRDERTERTTTTLESSVEDDAASAVETLPTVTTALPTTSSTVTTVAPTTAAPATTLPPVTVAPPAPNRPLRAELVVVTPSVRVGETATVDVNWSDPDLAGGPPRFAPDWRDPAISVGPAATSPQVCDRPGSASGGNQRLQFRYATPGTHDLSVVVSACDGVGAYAERVELRGRIVVGAPAAGLRAVVATWPRGTGVEPPPLDEADASYVPADDPDHPVASAARQPVMSLFGTSGPATVLLVPTGAVGVVQLRWPDAAGRCLAGTIDLTGADPAATPSIPLTLTC